MVAPRRRVCLLYRVDLPVNLDEVRVPLLFSRVPRGRFASMCAPVSRMGAAGDGSCAMRYCTWYPASRKRDVASVYDSSVHPLAWRGRIIISSSVRYVGRHGHRRSGSADTRADRTAWMGAGPWGGRARGYTLRPRRALCGSVQWAPVGVDAASLSAGGMRITTPTQRVSRVRSTCANADRRWARLTRQVLW